MTDRELLESAAKAAGITLKDNWGNFLEVDERGCCHCWFPLSDDGQALRLAAKLGISVSYSHSTDLGAAYGTVVEVGAFAGWCPTFTEAGATDWAAATRRAIVRAVAALAS